MRRRDLGELTMTNGGQNILWAGIFKIIFAGAVLAFLFGQAWASVIDRPFFRANALVIIFSGGDFVENNGEAPLAHDFVLLDNVCLLYTSPSPRDATLSRMPSSA